MLQAVVQIHCLETTRVETVGHNPMHVADNLCASAGSEPRRRPIIEALGQQIKKNLRLSVVWGLEKDFDEIMRMILASLLSPYLNL